jgi:hypothetical protein
MNEWLHNMREVADRKITIIGSEVRELLKGPVEKD